MNTHLDHLPEAKRDELARILEILFREFEDATKNRKVARRQGRILKVLLTAATPATTGWTTRWAVTSRTMTC